MTGGAIGEVDGKTGVDVMELVGEPGQEQISVNVVNEISLYVRKEFRKFGSVGWKSLTTYHFIQTFIHYHLIGCTSSDKSAEA